jgi:hypothetical protein
VFFFVVVIAIFTYLLSHTISVTSYSISLTNGSSIVLAEGTGTLEFLKIIGTKGVEIKFINKL